MKTGFKILVFNLLHILVIAPFLAFFTILAVAVFILLAEYIPARALWLLFALISFLLGWLARCCQLRAPFIPATLLAAWILMGIGLFADEMSVWLYVPFCWAGFFVPFPVRSKGLWDISMPWISQCPLVMLPLTLAIIFGSFWVLDGIDLGYGTGDPDGGLIFVARNAFFEAFAESENVRYAYMRIDNHDFSKQSIHSGGVYVRKGEIHHNDVASDSLLLIFDESRMIQSGGSLYSRRVRPMHTGLTVSGGHVRLSVAEFKALDLSDFAYRSLH